MIPVIISGGLDLLLFTKDLPEAHVTGSSAILGYICPFLSITGSKKG
jgi:hypothetical protein